MIGLRYYQEAAGSAETSRSCWVFTRDGKLNFLLFFFFFRWLLFIETGNLLPPPFSLHSSDSEGTFGTPEAESPGVEKILARLDNSNHTGEKHPFNFVWQ